MIEPTTAATFSSPKQPRTKKRTNRSRSQWKSLIDDFHRSGLTKVTFCKQYGVATSSLNRWQQILAQESGGDFIDVTGPVSVAPAVPPSTREGDDAWQVELALGNNIVLRMRTV
jgi:hypothetical protein